MHVLLQLWICYTFSRLPYSKQYRVQCISHVAVICGGKTNELFFGQVIIQYYVLLLLLLLFFFFWCNDHHREFLIIWLCTFCLLLLLVLHVFLKLFSFALITEGCRCWQANSKLCPAPNCNCWGFIWYGQCDWGKHTCDLPTPTREALRCCPVITWFLLHIYNVYTTNARQSWLSRAGIAWNLAGVDTCYCFLLFQWLGKCLRQFVLDIYSLRTENNFEIVHKKQSVIIILSLSTGRNIWSGTQGQYASHVHEQEFFLVMYNFDLFFFFPVLKKSECRIWAFANV